MSTLLLTPLHMGPLHPYEQALTLLLAFGPFVVLVLVVRAQRRRAAAEEAEPESAVSDPRPATRSPHGPGA